MHHLIAVMAVSERFACRVTGQHRTTQRHQPAAATPADPDAALRDLAARVGESPSAVGFPPRLSRRPRRGLGREPQEDPAVVARGRAAGAAAPTTQTSGRQHRTGKPTADAPNRVWAVDFQFDATTDGRPVKIVSIIDEHTRECLGGLVERSITADVLIDELDRLAAQRGYPAVLRCDNGPELACAAMADWAGERVGLSFIPPGEPWRNGYVESFNSRVRDECLNINIFWSLAQARVVIGDWKDEYNQHRRHSAARLSRPRPSTLPPAPTDERR